MPIESYETQYTFDTDDKFPIVISTRKYWVYSATFFFFWTAPFFYSPRKAGSTTDFPDPPSPMTDTKGSSGFLIFRPN